jgi:protein disulfide-isomerase
MKKILVTLLLVVSSLAVNAQENLTWHTDMAKASELSIKEKKPLLLFFTGSDWCVWCIRLQKEVLKTDDFAKWAKDNVILVELDFPRRTPQDEATKKQNFELQNLFQVTGYPTIWFVNPEKKEGKTNLVGLGSMDYVAGGTNNWMKVANNIIKK